MKLLFIIITVLILNSCTNNQQIDNAFEKYYTQINIPDYPILFDCYKESNLKKYFNDTLISNFKPEGSAIFGRLNIQ